MINIRVPEGVRKVADQIKNIFLDSAHLNYSNICSLLVLFLFDLENLSELGRNSPWTSSTSELSRAVQGFKPNRFMRRLQKSILRRYRGKINADDFCLAVDDTDNPKYGKGIFRAGKWQCSKGKYFGQKILMIVLVDIKRGIALPLSYEILAKKGEAGYELAFDVVTRLLEELFKAGVPKIPLVADSWFFSADFATKLKKMGVDFIGEMKSNRKVKKTTQGHKNWSSPLELFSGLKKKKFGKKKAVKWYQECLLRIKKLDFKLKVIAVYNNRKERNPFAYYASTNSEISGAKIFKYYKARWKIECLFRDLKQWLSFGRLPCRGENAAHLAVCLPLALIVSLRLDSPQGWGLDKRNSIGKMISIIRENALEKSLEFLVHNKESKLVDDLRARRDRSRVNKKCVNRTAEEMAA